jgi:hypothetical protein
MSAVAVLINSILYLQRAYIYVFILLYIHIYIHEFVYVILLNKVFLFNNKNILPD